MINFNNIVLKIKKLFSSSWNIRGNNGESAFHIRNKKRKFIIDLQTSYDLEIPDFIKRFNRTLTSFGDQLFYHKLHSQPDSLKAVKESQARVLELGKREKERTLLTKYLNKIGKQERGNVVDDIWDGLEYRPTMFRIIPYWFFIAPITVIISFSFGSIGLIFLLFYILTNIIIFIKTNNFIGQTSISMGYLIKAVKLIRKYNRTFKNGLYRDKLSIPISITPITKFSFLFRNDAYNNPLDPIGALIMYFRIMLMGELFAYYSVYTYFTKNREIIRSIIREIGELDVELNSLKLLENGACSAGLDNIDSIEFKDIKNPLIDNYVPQTFKIDGNYIITGMNMAGKSSFLKSIALNQILATSMGFAFAKEFNTSDYYVYTSLKIKDSILEGKSKYYAEAERLINIKELLKKRKTLAIIDEILTGTNSEDRIRASISILKEYSKSNNSIILAATHDIEIASSLEGPYNNIYFEGITNNDRINYDYKINNGIVRNTNGIKLLQYLGLNV